MKIFFLNILHEKVKCVKALNLSLIDNKLCHKSIQYVKMKTCWIEFCFCSFVNFYKQFCLIFYYFIIPCKINFSNANHLNYKYDFFSKNCKKNKIYVQNIKNKFYRLIHYQKFKVSNNEKKKLEYNLFFKIYYFWR